MKTENKKPASIPEAGSEVKNTRPDLPHDVNLGSEQGDETPTYSEEHDVTPPEPHEFPSVGNPETDFVSPSRHGRKTGRMLDHEPGL